MALNNSNPLARPSSPLFGAAYPSLPLLSARDEAALVTDRKPVDAADSVVFHDYFAHYGALG
ncbi:hypothetical protein Q8G46_28030, partial [Klebsiella pneumoniae]